MNDAMRKSALLAQLPISALLTLLPSSNLDALANNSLGSMHTNGNVWEDRPSINALVRSKTERTDLEVLTSSTQTLCRNPRLFLALHR